MITGVTNVSKHIFINYVFILYIAGVPEKGRGVHFRTVVADHIYVF